MLRPEGLEPDTKNCRSQIPAPHSGPTSFGSGRLCNTRLWWKLPQSESRLNSHRQTARPFLPAYLGANGPAERAAVPLTHESMSLLQSTKSYRFFELAF